MRGLALVLALAMLGHAIAGAPRAHPPAILNEAARKVLAEEIVAFRKALAAAIAAKNTLRLRDMYAQDFVHTRSNGALEDRDARMSAVLAGEPVIETAPVADLVIRAPNDWTAIATGLSPIFSKVEGRNVEVRWTSVYSRLRDSWVLAASHATVIREIRQAPARP